MQVCDWVLRAIEAEIAAHPPERGGALLGPPGRPLLTHFAPDPDAATTSASYRPSRALDARVKELEVAHDLELKGIVHSHPVGLDHPSDHDATELAAGLQLNGHMAAYLAPIVTGPWSGELERHELRLGAGKISFFAGQRTRAGAARVHPVRVHVVPLLRDLERVARELGGGPPETFVTDAGEGPLLAGRVRLDGAELLVLASEAYPTLPPALLVTQEGGPTEQIDARWALAEAPERRLAGAVVAAFKPPGPYRRAFGPRGGPALTDDATRARLAGWETMYTGSDGDARAEALRSALLERGVGILPRALRERSALVVGCGSVGCYLAEQLVRSGVGGVTLVDPDVVDAVNLSRTCYEVADVGRLKVEALAGRLLNVAPALRVAVHARAVEELLPAELDALVREADVVLAATDDPAAQRALDRFAYARGRPALFAGLYAGARGGEVLLTVPSRTPCYLCATRTRHQAEAVAGRVERELDYTTGRLQGEAALGADIQHVASAAVKLALATLLPPGTDTELHELLEAALAEGMTYLTLSTVPRYWFYPRIFADVAGQGAYQSVWLSPTASPECPVCGPIEGRVDPLDVPLRAPGRQALAAAARDAGRPP